MEKNVAKLRRHLRSPTSSCHGYLGYCRFTPTPFFFFTLTSANIYNIFASSYWEASVGTKSPIFCK